MDQAASEFVDDGVVASFHRDGAVVLRGVFRDWMESLRRGVDRNIADPGPYTRGYTPEGKPGRFFGDYCNWQRFPEYREFIFNSPAAEIVSRLIGSKTVRIFHEHVLVKEPGTGERTPWHHDQPYYGVNGKQNASLWTPLDPVPRDTCPEFIAGSHTWGRWFLPRKFIGVDYERPDEDLEPIPDFDNHRDEYEILSWDLEPGDAIAFSFLTVHGAPPNLSSTRRRRGFSTRWIGDDATYALRSGETSPPFPELEGVLEHGDPMDHPLFPLVWQEN
ncbi:MAG: phytanoyl-CoA dioxygenase family protein [Gammaproteobacteria bacterium]|nr:phytanoyl-CoA dioxygenase family protein [Gammaproteobacteria bacterium]